MQLFTGFQYLLIDAANQFGLDKLLFEERIQWAMDNLANLEALTDQAEAKTKPLYVKAVQAIRKAQALTSKEVEEEEEATTETELGVLQEIRDALAAKKD